jgi:hypothetical protein
VIKSDLQELEWLRYHARLLEETVREPLLRRRACIALGTATQCTRTKDSMSEVADLLN